MADALALGASGSNPMGVQLSPPALSPKTKKLSMEAFLFWVCAGEDSNLQAFAGTSPSSWRVYQFLHPRIEPLYYTKTTEFLNGFCYLF